MRIPTRDFRQGLRFNLTPLIDVVFLLIIFFLAASHLARQEPLAAVELPQAGTGQPEASTSPRRVVLTLSADGTCTLGGKTMSPGEVRVHLTEAVAMAQTPRLVELRIRTDRRTPYRFLEPLLLESARLGITRIRFAVLPED